MRMNTRHTQSGFSLLELAIAITILAILAGGALKGRELINTANVQATATDLANLETAITAFRSRYSALPGDFGGAANAGLNANGGANGNNNGQIDNTEISVAYSHLQQAGFISGNYVVPNPAVANCAAASCQESALGGFYVLSNAVNTATPPPSQLSIQITDSASGRLLAELDRKMDDGNPSTGDIQDSTAAPGCTTAGAAGTADDAWTETNNNCSALYFIR